MINMSARTRFFLMKFVAGIFSSQAFAGAATTAQLHLPWPLFESELQSVMAGESVAPEAPQNPAPWRATLPDTSVSVGGLKWNLSGVRVDAQVTSERPLFDGSRLFVRATKLSMRLGVDKVSVSQVIEREVSGALIRVHLTASCGPIRLIQEQAQTEAGFNLDWSSGEPIARLAAFGLAWTPGTWSVSEFACEGPQGFDKLLRDEILKRVKEPTELKPLIADWLASEVQSRLQTALGKVKEPLALTTGQGRVPMRVGRMTPASTGLVTDILFGDSQEIPPASPLPHEQVLAELPKDAPIFIGKMPVVEHLVQAEMGARDAITTVDLRTFSSFKSLIGSRFLQFFVWQDLFNFTKESPFWLRVKTPKELRFSVDGEGNLTSPIPLQAVVQSQRDGKWWDYVVVNGNAKATIQVVLKDGVMSLQTSLDQPNVDIRFGDAYVRQYQPGGWLPTSSIRSAIKGPQSMLSGSWPWPDVDLGVAGKFRSHELSWMDGQTFVITWRKVAAE